MLRSGFALVLGFAAAVTTATFAGAQTPAQRMASPARDLRGAADDPALPRYTGSVLLASGTAVFEEVVVPRGTLVEQGARDAQGNRNFVDPAAIRVEGRRVRLLYVLPPGRTPLEAVRGYQQAVRAAGGQVAYECAEQACGGETRRGAVWGGGWAGMVNRVYPKPEIPTAMDSPVYCALAVGHTDQRYTALRLKGGGAAGVLAYRATDGCGGTWTDRTVVAVLLGEPQAREQRMTTVSADAMAGGMASEGKVALYALFFDTGKSDLKPESTPQLAEMGRYLARTPSLRVLVVGHTDNQGALAANVELSRRRAQAVVDALVRTQGVAAARLTPQGVGMAAPVASNQAEAGRAKNRRVELVQQ